MLRDHRQNPEKAKPMEQWRGLNFMRTIAFVTQKGGSGKSTLAACLAVAAQEKGERVFLIDTDPLMSLSKWAKARRGKDIPVEWVPAGKLQSALAILEKKGISLAIIDTGAGESPAAAAAIKAADLCIIPARPNAFDLWASELTRKACSAARKEFAFLLNQCPPAQQSARIEDGAKALEAMGGLLTPLVSTRVDYQEAARHGLGVTELNPQGVAAEEMRDLWASVKRRMARSKSTGVKKAA
jgi:chromosome partitioning protein